MAWHTAFRAALIATGTSLAFSGSVSAQEAANPDQPAKPAAATEANELPAVEVTTVAEKPKPKKKKVVAKKKDPAPAKAPVSSGEPSGAGEDTVVTAVETPTSHIEGYVAKTSATGTKTGAPLLEIPQSISVVTSDQIADQGAQTLSQALHYTPGVVVDLNGGTSRYSEARIRGFTPIQYLDGLPVPLNNFFATPRIEPYGLERIEVLKGPASFLFGQNSPGGLLNMISKHPTETSFNEVELQFGSYDRYQTSFDFGGPVGQNKRVLYRVTGVLRDSDTEVDHTRDDLAFIAPAITLKPTDDTTLTILGQYSADYGTFPHQYVPAQGSLLPNPNGRISRHTFLGEPDWDKFDREQWNIGYEFDQKLGTGLAFRSNARVSSVDNLFRAHRVEGLQADLETVNRGAYQQATDALSFSIDNQLQADFTTGALAHEVLFGTDYARMSGGWDFQGAFPPVFGGTVQPINIFHPVYGAQVPPLMPFAKVDVTQEQVGVYLQDQIKLGGWVLTLGGRHDWADSQTTDLLAGGTTNQDDTDFTGRAGLTYVFANGIAPYISYATSFLPVAGIDRLGNPFKPSTGRQYEAGIKYQPPGTNALITAAVFDILQSNVLTTDAFDPTFQTQTGEVQVRGFDIDARANITSNLELIGGYAFLDSEITASNDPALLGNQVDLVPRHQASLWTKYRFSEGSFAGLSLGAGVRYTGELYAPLQTPSVTLADAMVSYELGHLDAAFKGAELAVNVTNLFDKYYVQGYCDPTYCSLGQGRLVLGTIKYRW